MSNNLTRNNLESFLLELSDDNNITSRNVVDDIVEEWFPEDVTMSIKQEIAPDISDDRFGAYIMEVDDNNIYSLTADTNGQLVDSNDCGKVKDTISREKIVCKNKIKEVLNEIIQLNKTINETRIDFLPDYDELKEKKRIRADLIEKVWKIYCESKGIEYIEPEKVLTVNTNHPKVIQNFYFNSQTNRIDAQKDTIEANFDKDSKIETYNTEKVVEGDDVSSEDDNVNIDCNSSDDEIIPADCSSAIRNVLLPTYTNKNKIVLITESQIKKAAELINLGSNSEVAMLMAICIEVKAIKPNTSCTNFVRTLIGLKLIHYNDRVVGRMADGIAKKIKALSDNHSKWSSKDLPIGMKLFEAMMKQD